MYTNCSNNNFLDFSCDDHKKNFIRKIKNKNIFIETIFANDLKEITINKNKYTFNINFITSNGDLYNWDFNYKPGKRGNRRKKKNLKNIENSIDSGYESEISKSQINAKSESFEYYKSNINNNIVQKNDINKKINIEFNIDEKINKQKYHDKNNTEENILGFNTKSYIQDQENICENKIKETDIDHNTFKDNVGQFLYDINYMIFGINDHLIIHEYLIKYTNIFSMYHNLPFISETEIKLRIEKEKGTIFSDFFKNNINIIKEKEVQKSIETINYIHNKNEYKLKFILDYLDNTL